jgi:(S)-mandelate dehydrogenase
MISQLVGNPELTEVSPFVRDNVVGCFSWDDLRLIRRAWPGHPILKGIMSSQDALFARDIGADGVFVSNHGGRQLDASAASVDVLPAIADALAGRVSLLMDGVFVPAPMPPKRLRWEQMLHSQAGLF